MMLLSRRSCADYSEMKELIPALQFHNFFLFFRKNTIFSIELLKGEGCLSPVCCAGFLAGSQLTDQSVDVSNVVAHVGARKDHTCYALCLVPKEDPCSTDRSANRECLMPDTETPLPASFIYVRFVEILMIPLHFRHLQCTGYRSGLQNGVTGR
jgi:hypothetical protein